MYHTRISGVAGLVCVDVFFSSHLKYLRFVVARMELLFCVVVFPCVLAGGGNGLFIWWWH